MSMCEEKLRILDLFKEGKISASETLEILDVLNEVAGSGEAELIKMVNLSA